MSSFAFACLSSGLVGVRAIGGCQDSGPGPVTSGDGTPGAPATREHAGVECRDVGGYCTVPLTRLLAVPGDWAGRRVRVGGYLVRREAYEPLFLCLTRDGVVLGAGTECVTFRAAEDLLPFGPFHGAHAVVEGEFATALSDGWAPNRVGDVKRVEVLSDVVPASGPVKAQPPTPAVSR